MTAPRLGPSNRVAATTRAAVAAGTAVELAVMAVLVSLQIAGAPPGARTLNQWVKSPLLYH